MTRVYHRTNDDAADAIRAGGFRDVEGGYLTDGAWRGVWVADVRAGGPDEGPHLSRVLTIDVPDEVLREYEWVEADKVYREFLVPAAVLNRYPVEDGRA